MEKPLQAQDYLNGQVLLVDKPLEWTSFQAVNAIKWSLKKRFGFKKIKIGHAGTLDPLATGLLLICTGKATKTISELQNQTKEYTGTIYLGASRPSYDCETEIEATYDIKHLSERQILNQTESFIGEITQRPPLHSAVKINGKRAYELARSGVEAQVSERRVIIYEFELTQIMLPEIAFRVVCSKGTYIRSLAHDFGKSLGVGGYLATLRRTKIGQFNVDKARLPQELKLEILGLEKEP